MKECTKKWENLKDKYVYPRGKKNKSKNQLTTTKSEDAGVEKVVASFCFYWPTPHMKQDTVTLARNEPEKA